MGILNNLNHKVITFYILLVNTSLLGLAKSQNDVDSIRITFSHLDGYAMYRCTACYKFLNNAFILQVEKPSHLNHTHLVPKTISNKSVLKLLEDCKLYSSEDPCEFIKITKQDYYNYIKIINDEEYIENNMPFLFDFKKELYELEEDAFLSLSCSEIIDIIESPYHIYASSKPSFRIELISNNSGKTTIEPQWYFEGTAWNVLTQGRKMYIDNKYLISFLEDIQYDKYMYLYERFYFLFHIADVLREREN